MREKTHDMSFKEKQQVLERVAAILGQREDVLFAYAYGSFTESLPFHDIDIGLHVADIKPDSAAGYAAEVALLLEQAVGLPVDVRILNFAPATFLYHVIRGLLILEKDETLRSDIVERTIRVYLDMKPLIRKGLQEAFAE